METSYLKIKLQIVSTPSPCSLVADHKVAREANARTLTRQDRQPSVTRWTAPQGLEQLSIAKLKKGLHRALRMVCERVHEEEYDYWRSATIKNPHATLLKKSRRRSMCPVLSSFRTMFLRRA